MEKGENWDEQASRATRNDWVCSGLRPLQLWEEAGEGGEEGEMKGAATIFVCFVLRTSWGVSGYQEGRTVDEVLYQRMPSLKKKMTK